MPKTRLQKRANIADPCITSVLILTSVKMQTVINHQFMKRKHQTPKCPLETIIFLIAIKSNDNSSMSFCEQLPAHSSSAFQGSPTALCLPLQTQLLHSIPKKRSWII